MGYLNVEDLRFDMISDIDYSHRSFAANISISSGMKVLKFKSYDQYRLRKLINHIQFRMSEIKRLQSEHEQLQKQNLEDINKQLQVYLFSQQEMMRTSFGANPKQPSFDLGVIKSEQIMYSDSTDRPIRDKNEEIRQKPKEYTILSLA